MTGLSSHLTFLYGAERAPQLLERVQAILDAYHGRIPARTGGLSERDAILITYGDQVQAEEKTPLATLNAFCTQHVSDILNGIHILPFYPWTSDDGFSVADYRRVDSRLGDWQDISRLGDHFRLMFDAVINHISSQSDWFQGFLRDDPRYREYFITAGGSPDLSRVVRPRTSPLLTPFSTPSGIKQVWTTFSADQIDLNYKNPEVLLEILDLLLLYAARGATFIRLDAIAYLWKEPGTACIHLPQTHRIVQFLRAALDEAAPHIQLVTETNVPHTENISYWGNGLNEAQLIYNFALPPLTLHAFHTGDARILSDWAKTLTPPSNKTAFFNFLASHDGIGLNPVRGILSEVEIEALVEKTLEHGGLVSHKHNGDGSQSPYELNINYFDALSNPQTDEPMSLQIDRFIAAQAVMLSLVGVPGIYFHSLFGSRGWPEGVNVTGHNRAINREKFHLHTLQRELVDAGSLRARVYSRCRDLLSIRRALPAFHPHGTQKILDLHPSVFALERHSADGTSRVLCLHNLSSRTIEVTLPSTPAAILLTQEPAQWSPAKLGPYQVLWISI